MFGGGGTGEAAATEQSAPELKSLIGQPTDILRAGGNKTKGGEATTVGETLTSDLKLLMFYFSMHNCPPCREFTPLLTELYQEVNESERVMEVVFFSGDP